MTEFESKSVQVLGQPVHVTLKQSAAGKYYWEISIHGESVEEVVNRIKAADTQLESEWGADARN